MYDISSRFLLLRLYKVDAFKNNLLLHISDWTKNTLSKKAMNLILRPCSDAY